MATSGVSFTSTGKGINSMINRLQQAKKTDYSVVLSDKITMGVAFLARRTPAESGKTRQSYSGEVKKTSYGYDLVFKNSDKTKSGVPIPILIHYGHGTGTGGYVPARPFLDDVGKSVARAVKADLERKMRSGR